MFRGFGGFFGSNCHYIVDIGVVELLSTEGRFSMFHRLDKLDKLVLHVTKDIKCLFDTSIAHRDASPWPSSSCDKTKV